MGYFLLTTGYLWQMLQIFNLLNLKFLTQVYFCFCFYFQSVTVLVLIVLIFEIVLHFFGIDKSQNVGKVTN